MTQNKTFGDRLSGNQIGAHTESFYSKVSPVKQVDIISFFYVGGVLRDTFVVCHLQKNSVHDKSNNVHKFVSNFKKLGNLFSTLLLLRIIAGK